MTDYPTGVTLANNTPVPTALWYQFSSQVNCLSTLQTIKGITTPSDNPNMYVYNNDFGYVYADPVNPTVAPYMYDCYGMDGSGLYFIQEYLADITDRQTIPNPVKGDLYVSGQTPILQSQRTSPTFGRLFWAAPNTLREKLKAKSEEPKKVEHKWSN
jgi:hypothetical protein